MRLLHLSDPHLQLRDWRTRPLLQLGPLRALATVELWKGRGRLFDGAGDALAAWARFALGYDHCLLTGDLTQLGLREEMQLARDALGPLAGDPARFTALPGNHDRYPWGGRAQRWFEELFPEQLQSDLPALERPLAAARPAAGPQRSVPLVRTRLLGEVALLLVDSSLPVSWPVVSGGAVPPAATAALQAALAAPEVRARCALVLTHHAPLRPHGRPDRPLHYLAGWRPFLKACRDGGAQALLCGHIHERFALGPSDELPLVLCAGSSTELGRRGAWELEVRGGRLQPPRLLTDEQALRSAEI
jgi:3',5'-cyclic AMP phosphodiesterase CpdA